jgi:hypothetical protein
MDGGVTGGGEQQGGGIKAAAQAAKKDRTKGPAGAKGHVWKPQWLGEYPWLRTEPSRTQQEWEDRSKEAPQYVFCICCCEYPNIGHKDVMQKRKPEAMRSDKLSNHQEASHDRALKRWMAKYGALKECDVTSELQPVRTPQAEPSAEFVEPPLASLVRTAVTVAVSKSALRLLPALIKLQRANGAAILEMTGDGATAGVTPLLHAAAVVLQRRQNLRLQAAGMLSKMGDGSSDRKTTEQVICTNRYCGQG